MIFAVKMWIFGLVAAAAATAVLYELLPKGSIRAIARVTGGLTMLLVLIRPLLGLDLWDFQWKYDGYRQEIDRQIQIYQEENQQQMAAIIQEKTQAYISEKAEQLGVTCQAEVEVALVDGIWQPVSATLHIPRHQELSHILSEDLGLGEDQQHWEVTP